MSELGARRPSTLAQGRSQSPDGSPALGGETPRTPAPHFSSAPLSPSDLDTVAEARSVLEDLRVHIAELDRREQDLNGQLTLLQREQRQLRAASQQFADERRELEQALDERQRVLSEREAAAEEQQQVVDAQQNSLDRQRADLREELWAELADEREQLQQLKGELEQAHGELSEAQADWHAQRQREVSEHAAELDQLRNQRLADVADVRRQLETRQAELEQGRAELAAAQEAWQAERETEITEHNALLDQLRAERLADVEAREADVGRREVDLIKRTRFQEDHLLRLRTEIEARQTELERNRASLTVWIEQVEATARRRLAHLRKYRDVLEHREHACGAAWQQLGDARDRQQAVLDELSRHVADEQSAFAEEQRALAGDIRRHADLLQLREQEVERRTVRIDQLSDELERRHQLLSAREDAVREAAEQLGEDAAGLLVPRDEDSAIPGPDVAAQRAEIADARRQLAQWRQELHDERESLGQLIADREERLHGREASLRRHLEQLVDRESALQEAQTRDRAEREQTYAVLESLVEQVEQRLRGEQR